MLGILEEVIYTAESYDFPLIRSCIPNLMAVRLFKDKGRVTLVGEGGDELFAGYESLRTARSEAKLRKMRVELLSGGHLTGFQRVDRMTSSASLDGRMPLMSDHVVSFALGLGPKDLLGPRRLNTKYVLRRAYEGLLPREIVWRRKRKFSDGAGSVDIMAAEAERTVSDRRFEMRSRMLGGKRVRTKEEMLYFEMFRKHFPSASAISSVGFTQVP
jgi:asparagine synthase (glutamine-hydrolysing)